MQRGAVLVTMKAFLIMDIPRSWKIATWGESKIGSLTKSCPWNTSHGGPWDSLASQIWFFLVTTCHAVIISLTMSCYIDISYNFVLINKFSLPFQPCLFVTNLAPTTMMTQTTTPTGIPTPANPLHQTFDWFSWQYSMLEHPKLCFVVYTSSVT